MGEPEARPALRVRAGELVVTYQDGAVRSVWVVGSFRFELPPPEPTGGSAGDAPSEWSDPVPVWHRWDPAPAETCLANWARASVCRALACHAEFPFEFDVVLVGRFIARRDRGILPWTRPRAPEPLVRYIP
jgi:hypothetical protein